MRIAICEDNNEHAEILEKMVMNWAKARNNPVFIGRYQSSEQFLFCMEDEQPYDLAFLDIQMSKMDGFELARRLRDGDKMMILVFTTGLKDYAPRGYEVSAYRYLIKPVLEKDVIEVLENAIQMLEKRKNDVIIVSIGDESRRIAKEDIYYIEVDNHYIILHFKDEALRFKAKLKEYEPEFKEPQFCKCHRSYIANLKHATTISREGIFLEGDITLPISKAHWNSVNHCYLEYYMS